MPLGLAQQGQRLYLVCRFEGYDNERSLAIHRIKKASVSTYKFPPPENFTLNQYDADGRFGFGEGEKCRISFCITTQAGFHLTETKLSADQHIHTHPNHLTITATVVRSKQLTHWLNGFGEQVWDIKFEELTEWKPNNKYKT